MRGNEKADADRRRSLSAPRRRYLSSSFKRWRLGATAHLDIHHITTGRGNATFFVLPDGTSLLVDAGDGRRRESPGVDPAARTARDDRASGSRATSIAPTPGGLDYLLITHFHGDHMGGLADLLDAIPVAKVLDRAWPAYDYPEAARLRPRASLPRAHRED